MKRTPPHIVKRIGQMSEQGESVSQIAEILGLSKPTVRTILEDKYNFKSKIRQMMEEIDVPWRYKLLRIGQIEYFGTTQALITAINACKKLNDVFFNEQYNRRWVVIVNRDKQTVWIKRVY